MTYLLTYDPSMGADPDGHTTVTAEDAEPGTKCEGCGSKLRVVAFVSPSDLEIAECLVCLTGDDDVKIRVAA